jgi:hypothetical protein
MVQVDTRWRREVRALFPRFFDVAELHSCGSEILFDERPEDDSRALTIV